jgi:hypothetical protein
MPPTRAFAHRFRHLESAAGQSFANRVRVPRFRWKFQGTSELFPKQTGPGTPRRYSPSTRCHSKVPIRWPLERPVGYFPERPLPRRAVRLRSWILRNSVRNPRIRIQEAWLAQPSLDNLRVVLSEYCSWSIEPWLAFRSACPIQASSLNGGFGRSQAIT